MCLNRLIRLKEVHNLVWSSLEGKLLVGDGAFRSAPAGLRGRSHVPEVELALHVPARVIRPGNRLACQSACALPLRPEREVLWSYCRESRPTGPSPLGSCGWPLASGFAYLAWQRPPLGLP